jgi:hypothetical protein
MRYPHLDLTINSSAEEEAGEDLDEETTEDDEREDTYFLSRSAPSPGGKKRRGSVIPSHTGEMGDLGASFARFLSWSSDLPMRASFSFANLALARRCCGVCACTFDLCVSLGLRWFIGMPATARHDVPLWRRM